MCGQLSERRLLFSCPVGRTAAARPGVAHNQLPLTTSLPVHGFRHGERPADRTAGGPENYWRAVTDHRASAGNGMDEGKARREAEAPPVGGSTSELRDHLPRASA